jgi:hypothetical protein
MISAGNGIGPVVTQQFTLVVDQPPAFTSADALTARVGVPLAPFRVTATGYPQPQFAATGLPAGVMVSALGTLSGTPLASDAVGPYPVTITASSAAGTAIQNFTLTLTP